MLSPLWSQWLLTPRAALGRQHEDLLNAALWDSRIKRLQRAWAREPDLEALADLEEEMYERGDAAAIALEDRTRVSRSAACRRAACRPSLPRYPAQCSLSIPARCPPPPSAAAWACLESASGAARGNAFRLVCGEWRKSTSLPSGRRRASGQSRPTLPCGGWWVGGAGLAWSPCLRRGVRGPKRPARASAGRPPRTARDAGQEAGLRRRGSVVVRGASRKGGGSAPTPTLHQCPAAGTATRASWLPARRVPPAGPPARWSPQRSQGALARHRSG